MPDSFSVYILQSKQSGRFYIGHTNNLSERIKRHNTGRTLANKSKGPHELVHVEYFPTRTQATTRERQIKSRKSRSYIERLIRTSRA
jgi:putative endonuclease